MACNVSASIDNSFHFSCFLETHSLSFQNIVNHIVNSVYAVSDMFVTGLPHRILHFWVALILPIAYSIFTLVYFACGGGPCTTFSISRASL